VNAPGPVPNYSLDRAAGVKLAVSGGVAQRDDLVEQLLAFESEALTLATQSASEITDLRSLAQNEGFESPLGRPPEHA
jgi:hypothetical protein